MDLSEDPPGPPLTQIPSVFLNEDVREKICEAIRGVPEDRRAQVAIDILVGTTNALDHVDTLAPQVVYDLIYAATSCALHSASKARRIGSALSTANGTEIYDKFISGYRVIESAGQELRKLVRVLGDIANPNSVENFDLPGFIRAREEQNQQEEQFQQAVKKLLGK